MTNKNSKDISKNKLDKKLKNILKNEDYDEYINYYIKHMGYMRPEHM